MDDIKEPTAHSKPGQAAPGTSGSAADSSVPPRVEEPTVALDIGATAASPPGSAGNESDDIGVIGRYRIIRRLGKGSFGRVFLARDDELDRSVAIKVPNPERISRPEDVEAYLAEARTLGRLDHPHIVPVYDVGRTEDGLCFIVSKYIEGSDLATKLAHGRPSFRDSSLLIAVVAEALHHAHLRGLVHRDIKPANILMDSAGQPYVADFGLALSVDNYGKEGGSGGTPSYMSPEQAQGEGHLVDGRTDIYSLGVVLYELITGRKPFRGETLNELVQQVTKANARPPRQIDDTIPKELERICLKALAKRATERYTTARDLAEDLRNFAQSDSPTKGATPGTTGVRLSLPLDQTELLGDPLGAKRDPEVEQAQRRFTARVEFAVLGLVMAAALLGLALQLWPSSASKPSGKDGTIPDLAHAAGPVSQTPLIVPASPSPVEIHIVYGTEKQRWLEPATAEFAKTPAGAGIKVHIHGMESLGGAQAVLDGPSPFPVHVWSPASSAYRDLFEQEWRVNHRNPPIIKAENLALTPMVFVMWKDRRDAYIKKYGKVSFKTIGQAMQEPKGWDTIAAQPWGRFKFSHTDPGRSNSGLITLVLMAYEFAGKESGLTLEDLAQQRFLEWLRALSRPSSGPAESWLTAPEP